MSKTFEFGGRTVVIAHITSCWIEAATIVHVALSSGEVVQQNSTDDVGASLVLQNIHDILNDNLHQ